MLFVIGLCLGTLMVILVFLGWFFGSLWLIIAAMLIFFGLVAWTVYLSDAGYTFEDIIDWESRDERYWKRMKQARDYSEQYWRRQTQMQEQSAQKEHAARIQQEQARIQEEVKRQRSAQEQKQREKTKADQDAAVLSEIIAKHFQQAEGNQK